MREIPMREDMYTYHYFKNRCLVKSVHRETVLLSSVVLFGIVYFISTLLICFK